MAESLDKGLQIVTKVTKYAPAQLRYLKTKGKAKEGIEILHEAYKIAQEEEKCYQKREVFGVLVESFLENELYDETISLYEDSIQSKKGVGCNEDVLIIVILCLVNG
jgi:hypothetical protein